MAKPAKWDTDYRDLPPELAGDLEALRREMAAGPVGLRTGASPVSRVKRSLAILAAVAALVLLALVVLSYVSHR